MVHACVCCQLRFASNGELADHVRTDHSEDRSTFTRSTVQVVRHHFPQPAPRRERAHRASP